MNDSLIEREGKLVVEVNGNRYQMIRDKDSGVCSFIGSNEKDLEALRLAYAQEYCKESLAADESGDYWYERPYHIGMNVAESLGAKVIEYEDDKYKKFYEDGTPILY